MQQSRTLYNIIRYRAVGQRSARALPHCPFLVLSCCSFDQSFWVAEEPKKAHVYCTTIINGEIPINCEWEYPEGRMNVYAPYPGFPAGHASWILPISQDRCCLSQRVMLPWVARRGERSPLEGDFIWCMRIVHFPVIFIDSSRVRVLDRVVVVVLFLPHCSKVRFLLVLAFPIPTIFDYIHTHSHTVGRFLSLAFVGKASQVDRSIQRVEFNPDSTQTHTYTSLIASITLKGSTGVEQPRTSKRLITR